MGHPSKKKLKEDLFEMKTDDEFKMYKLLRKQSAEYLLSFFRIANSFTKKYNKLEKENE